MTEATEDNRKKVRYVFVGNNNHPKSCITFERLYETSFLTPDNCILISNKNIGSFVSFGSNLGFHIIIARNDDEMYMSLKDYRFDYLISCGWHRKISIRTLRLADKFSINSHSSYLPDYKGLSAYKHAWANGETHTGNSIHIMDDKFDTGTILAQSKIRIYWWDTPRTILLRIAEHTPALIMLAIERLERGVIGVNNNARSGRYFLKTSNIQFVFIRVYNLVAQIIGLKKITTKSQTKSI